MNVYQAIQAMRQLTKDNVPFSISYLSCDLTKGGSNGVKHVANCLLRTGLSKQKSKKHNSLVAYTNLDGNKPRTFYIPLLLTFNNIEIQ